MTVLDRNSCKFYFTLCMFCFVSAIYGQDLKNKVNPNESKQKKTPVELADPTIFYSNGTYYLYGTGGNTDNGFLVYTSTNLKNWQGPKGSKGGYALSKGDTYGTTGFWAPQVFVYKAKFYMAYTANEQLAIAVSDSPLGPFKQKTRKKLSSVGKQIDPFIFIDDDGKIYLYHVRLDNGNKLFVVEMKPDLSDIIPETGHLCLEATDSWENTENTRWPVTEGPTVVKRNGLYYLFYSANDFRNKDYAVGYAVSTTPYGPWVKSVDNPILSRNLIKQNGSGHGDLFMYKNGEWKYVFHLHSSSSSSEVNPRKTAIVNCEFVNDQTGKEKIKMTKKSFLEITVNQ
jgi:xylan 1,4-beta-xylosidase